MNVGLQKSVESEQVVPLGVREAFSGLIAPVLSTMRPAQWTKNVFVLAPLVFTQKLGDPACVKVALTAFASFSLMASGVYFVNDIMDVEQDRLHPRKRHRAIAAGRLSLRAAHVATCVLFAASLALAWGVGHGFILALGCYLLLNLAYSNGLKEVVILDVMVVASGFVIRAIAGAAALSVPVSDWLFICTTMVALFLAFTKRRQEIIHLGDGAASHRRSLSHYTVPFLDQMIAVTTSSTVLTYSLYALSPEVALRLGNNLRWTVPFVLFGIFRYLFLVHVRQEPGDPTSTLLGDAPSIVNVIAWGIVVILVLY